MKAHPPGAEASKEITALNDFSTILAYIRKAPSMYFPDGASLSHLTAWIHGFSSGRQSPDIDALLKGFTHWMADHDGFGRGGPDWSRRLLLQAGKDDRAACRLPRRPMKLLRVLFCLIASLTAAAQETDRPRKSAEPPDHLEPVNPYPFPADRRYRDEWISRLQLEPPNLPPGFLRMIMRPSFVGESAVRLHGGKDEFYFNDAEKFVLTYTVADQNIYASLPHDRTKAPGEVHVSVITVELSKSLATRIHTLWKRMLMRTRYTEPSADIITDGTAFEFGTLFLHGETRAPGTGKSPDLFVDLGISLMDFCKAAPEERPAAEKKIAAKATLLEKYLDQHPVK